MPKKIKRPREEKRRAKQERMFREHHERRIQLISLSTQSLSIAHIP